MRSVFVLLPSPLADYLASLIAHTGIELCSDCILGWVAVFFVVAGCSIGQTPVHEYLGDGYGTIGQ
jgi:hypothetical protein